MTYLMAMLVVTEFINSADLGVLDIKWAITRELQVSWLVWEVEKYSGKPFLYYCWKKYL